MNINQLCDRYNIASKKTLYRRLEGIGLQLNKDNGKVNATKKQVELLDQLNHHISKGNSISSFVPLSPSEVLSQEGHSETPPKEILLSQEGHSETYPKEYPLGQLILAPEITNLISQILAKKDPLLPQKTLQLAVFNNWELSTSQIKDIIGWKPRIRKGENCYTTGSFSFYKVGRINKETAWIIKRKVDQN